MTSDAVRSYSTGVQVRFSAAGDLGEVDHEWTVRLDYNFAEVPAVGDTVIVRGWERAVNPSGVDDDGTINFFTTFEGKTASVPLEVMGRAWLPEGVLLLTVPFDALQPDDAEGPSTLLRALDIMGFKSRSRGPQDK